MNASTQRTGRRKARSDARLSIAPMARAVIGGLITSTILTLFVVPVVYTLLDDAAAWMTSRRRAGREPVPAPSLTPRPEPLTRVVS